ncbi:MAG: hypothetical protein HQK51_19035 [Oligoflexia bacterium]|nr:hypothetical protein [Oligoflexia bacterium]
MEPKTLVDCNQLGENLIRMSDIKTLFPQPLDDFARITSVEEHDEKVSPPLTLPMHTMRLIR